MMYTIPKARMHPVERWAAIAGLTLAGFGTGFASVYLSAGDSMPLALSIALTGALWLHRPDQVEYRMEPDGLRVGSRLIRFTELREVRVVRLRGTILYGGVALPGYWFGRAWSRGLGRFTLQGSTGLGTGVLLVTAGGDRVVITPDQAVDTVVTLHVRMRAATRRSALPR